jgi:hypothetical protein
MKVTTTDPFTMDTWHTKAEFIQPPKNTCNPVKSISTLQNILHLLKIYNNFANISAFPKIAQNGKIFLFTTG